MNFHASIIIIVHFSFTISAADLSFNAGMIEQNLSALDRLNGDDSYTFSYSMFHPEAQIDAFRRLSQSPVANFVPLFEALVAAVKARETGNRVIGHIAIRVDPNGERIEKNFERRATSTWHSHTTDNYLFTLTRSDELTTLLRIDGNEVHININELYLLKGHTLHRTPRAAPGKRIHVSIGILDYSQFL